MHPKVFVSHASEDKDRFVTEFATKLRTKGVDAWFDKWEMLPGDSLVDKIFEEGLKEAHAVIIVLSNYSIGKPWVREELNTSIVNKISNGTKIIPVVLDGCKVPESLISTVWEPISDLNSYDDSFKRILSSIFGITDKPALGNAPAHTSSVYHEISGLTKADNLVLKESCDYITKNNNMRIQSVNVFGDDNNIEFSRSEIKDCIEVLKNHGYLDIFKQGGVGDNYRCYYKVTTFGFDIYARTYIDNYSAIMDKIVSAIVNENIKNNNDLVSKVDESEIIVNHILDVLESNDHVKLIKIMSGMVIISHIGASLRRALA